MATNRTVTLYHVTHEDNWYSINEHGLLIAKSTGRLRVVWLVTKSKLQWAARHASSKRDWTPDSLMVFKVTVRRSQLIRTNMRGVWRSIYDVTPDRILDSGVFHGSEK